MKKTSNKNRYIKNKNQPKTKSKKSLESKNNLIECKQSPEVKMTKLKERHKHKVERILGSNKKQIWSIRPVIDKVEAPNQWILL